MGASASQIASARALASSRGYDPNLVDADNADRANSAFPVQSGGGGGSKSSSGGGGGGSSSKPATPAPVAGLQGSAPTTTPSAGAAAPTPGSEAGPASAAVSGLQGAAPMSSLGGGGADQDVGMGGAAVKPTLGSRIPPQENLILASLRRAY